MTALKEGGLASEVIFCTEVAAEAAGRLKLLYGMGIRAVHNRHPLIHLLLFDNFLP